VIPLRSLSRRFWALVRLGAPPALILRFWGWVAGYAAREFALQFSAILATAIAILLLEGVSGSLGTAALVLLALLLAIELRFAWASWRSAAVIDRELQSLAPGAPAPSRFPRSHLVFPALMLVPRGVVRERGIVFHREEGRRVRLDVFRPKAAAGGDEPRPAIIQVHGGGWVFGSRLEQGIPLLNHLAANGWVGFNVDYRLSPRATMPEHVIDVKRAIAWVREHHQELGVDPRRVCITGGSAGGHLCALAALTARDPTLQPGFEDADTSVAAAVPFYGLYDLLDDERRYYPGVREWLMAKIVVKRSRESDPEAFRLASPTHRVHPDAPPFLIFHGEEDTLVPVADARAFAARLEAVSDNPALYVELPGSEHAFDLAPSLRTARVAEGIERFLRTAVADPKPAEPAERVASPA
jgi:acetyl esterase/lipase